MARAARRGVARDHEILLQAALELDPAPRAAGDVDRVRLLADQPLEAELAGVLEHLRRGAREVVAEADVRVAGELRLQLLLAFGQRQRTDVLAVEERRV